MLCYYLLFANINFCCSVAKSCLVLCNPMDCCIPDLPVPHHLLEFAQVHVVWIGDTIQPSHPLLPSFPSAFDLSQPQGLFQWVGCSHQVAKVLELQLRISPFNEYPKLISFRIDWLALRAVLGILKGIHQYYSSKAPILQQSAFFMVHIWVLSVLK